MKNPAFIVPDAMEAMQALAACGAKGRACRAATLDLVHLRASQINGCSVCVDMHARLAKKHGETRRAHVRRRGLARGAVLQRRRARGAGADRGGDAPRRPSDGVPDAIWDEAARHFDERGAGALVLNIALINFFNRLNATTRQVAGAQRWEG